MVELVADAVAKVVDLLGAVVGGVDMDAERPLPGGSVDDLADAHGDLVGVGVGRCKFGEPGVDLVHEASVAVLVGTLGLRVGGCPAWAKWLVPVAGTGRHR